MSLPPSIGDEVEEEAEAVEEESPHDDRRILSLSYPILSYPALTGLAGCDPSLSTALQNALTLIQYCK